MLTSDTTPLPGSSSASILSGGVDAVGGNAVLPECAGMIKLENGQPQLHSNVGAADAQNEVDDDEIQVVGE